MHAFDRHNVASGWRVFPALHFVRSPLLAELALHTRAWLQPFRSLEQGSEALMKLVCPSCGFFASPEAFLGEADEQRALLLAFKVPSQLAASMHQYLRLFRPEHRALTARRVESLLAELLPMIEVCRIERRGRIWPAPVEAWRTALDEIVAKRDRLTLPLKSHGYLLEILVGYADKAEGMAETKREQDRAYPYSQERSSTGPQTVAALVQPKPEKTPIPESVSRQLADLGFSTKRKEVNDAC